MCLMLRFAAIAGSAIALPVGVVLMGLAQSIPPSGVTIPPTAPERIEEITPKPPEAQPLPTQPPQSTPPPRLEDPSPTPLPESIPATSGVFRVKRVQVLGSTVLTDEITKLTRALENKQVNFDDLVGLRSAITKLYVDNGYITSGAFLPSNQRLTEGIVQIQVIEGELEGIEITGLTRLRQSYIRSRLARAGKSPLNRPQLERGLQLLQLDPSLEQVNAELTAGSAPGRSILRLSLKEAPPLNAGIEIANNQPPSIGSIQGSVFASYANVTGFGDRISFDYGRTQGLNSYDILYALPLNGLNGSFNFRYSKNNSEIIEDIFQELGIRSESETLSFSVRQPLVRSPQTEFAIGLGLDLRQSQTFLLADIPFSFSIGPEDGKSRVTVIRFFQDWLNRSATRVLAARSQLNFGIDAFGATINDLGTDGRFFSWLGQFQWVQQWSPRMLMVARIDTQITPDSLLSLEQFSLGGVDTVRGYRQNQLVADNGILAALEFRIPLTGDPRILQLTPFVEVGTGWNNRTIDPDPRVIAGLGAGLRWQIVRDLNLRLDYGFPLVDVGDRGGSLQEQGFYFSLRYQPF
jgi:hemolysin activation/secretion protein